MIGATLSDQFVVGFVLGFAVGVLAGPLIRSWISWREADSAAREAHLLEDVLSRLDPGTTPNHPPSQGAVPRARIP